jgi:hypothetical protein
VAEVTLGRAEIPGVPDDLDRLHHVGPVGSHRPTDLDPDANVPALGDVPNPVREGIGVYVDFYERKIGNVREVLGGGRRGTRRPTRRIRSSRT